MEISELKVMKSRAGYYLGRSSIEGGMEMPYSRQSYYYSTPEAAQRALEKYPATRYPCEANNGIYKQEDEGTLKISEKPTKEHIEQFMAEIEAGTAIQDWEDGIDDYDGPADFDDGEFDDMPEPTIQEAG